MKIKLSLALLAVVGVIGAQALAQQSPQTQPTGPLPPGVTPPAGSTQAAAPAAPPPPVSTSGSQPAGSPAPVLVATAEGTPASVGAVGASDQVVDLVAFDAVPLPDAIRTLAMQASLNIDFDPRLFSGVNASGQPNAIPTVSAKWKNITAMQALTELLENYDMQLVWDSRTKIGRITAKNPNEPEPLLETVIQLRYASPTNIMAEVTPTISSRSRIIKDDRTHQLILMTTEKELPALMALIAKLDTPTREVLIEARIIETTKDITSAKGIDWTGTLSAQHVSFGNGLTSGTVVNTTTTTGTQPGPLSTAVNNVATLNTSVSPLGTSGGGGISLSTAHAGLTPPTAFLNADGVQAIISFLNSDNSAKTINFPRTVSLDGVPTTLTVIRNVPVFEQNQSAPAAGASQGLETILPVYDLSVNGTYLSEVGTKLTVTPRIAGPTNVLMDVRPEISEEEPALASQTLNGQTSTAPIFDRRRIETTASVPSGYTLVLGGLEQDVLSTVNTKVPVLGDVPGLGYAFRSANDNHTRDTILIFVTPTIIEDMDFQSADSSFLQTKEPGLTPMSHSPWDTTQPYDWTKPKPDFAPVYQP